MAVLPFCLLYKADISESLLQNNMKETDQARTNLAEDLARLRIELEKVINRVAKLLASMTQELLSQNVLSCCLPICSNTVPGVWQRAICH